MRILAHLRELDESQKDWERYQAISLKDLKRDRDKRNMVLHAMLVSIQAAIDVAAGLIVKEGLGKPTTYREAFEILGQAGLIPEELAEELSDLAGFRNVLVHIYWQLDLDQVYGVLQNDLKTLKSFLQEVKKLSDQDLSAE
ncbi:hypothetical protein MSSIT_0150 [Methanosarcina siciliae T4/M]|uniref:DUF86 domain-containing protein n=2 Tax=Methanosarcina siciliae TaxID=38027 RepID=A0A0E3L9T6_9EURY|nr:DUF86 domain-containing protein [Methanosarcina siciliae]AKB26869.1 hypothetical protein MSSIT_0150 [Methanosarcina siciliae T4/M]AKB30836.1 hypothetical protein MSSIH_0146 [Methanosarcina siciliae HI350]